MPHNHAKGVPCSSDCNKRSSLVDAMASPAMPPTRLIANIINALFAVFPVLGKKLNKQRATRLLTMMTTSGMLGSNFTHSSLRDDSEQIKYADYMIRYNDDVRSIARFVGIQTDAAVDFIRCCFATNKSCGMYPYTPSEESSWGYHKHLVTKFGDSIAQCITESMIGIIPSSRITDYFGILNRISKNMARASNAKFFILEGCSYVVEHKDQQRVKVPGQAEMIFIDEFINYMRELDETRYALFSDEIADLLVDAPSSFMPDCSAIIEHLDMSRFDDDIATVRTSFEKLIGKPKPEPEPVPAPVPVLVLEPESKEQFEEKMTAAEAATAAFFASPPSQLQRFLGGVMTLPGLASRGFALPGLASPGFAVSKPIFLGYRPRMLQIPLDDNVNEDEGDEMTPHAEDSDQEDH